MAATTVGAIREFWEHITEDSQATVCSAFSSRSQETSEKLSAGNAAFEDKRAVTIFLLQTGALEIKIEKAVDDLEYQKIVFPSVNESPSKESDSSKIVEEIANEAMKAAAGKSSIAQDGRKRPKKGRVPGTVSKKKKSSATESEKKKRVPESTSKKNVTKKKYSGKDAGDLVSETPGKKKLKKSNDRNDLEESEVRSYVTRSGRKVNVALPRLELGSKKRRKLEEVESDADLTDDDDDESDDSKPQVYEIVKDDEWVPDQDKEKEDEEIAKQAEEEMETDEEFNNPPDENQEGGEARVCEKCATIYYTPWDYDLHAMDCSLAESRTEYICHLCRSRCATKWGITYHLMKKHKFSGPEALAKVPELDIGRQMFSEEGVKCESSYDMIDDVDAPEKVIDDGDTSGKVTEDGDTPQKETDDVDTPENLMDNSNKPENVTDEGDTSGKVKDDREISRKVTNDGDTLRKVTDDVDTPGKVTDEGDTPEKGADDSHPSEKVKDDGDSSEKVTDGDTLGKVADDGDASEKVADGGDASEKVADDGDIQGKATDDGGTREKVMDGDNEIKEELVEGVVSKILEQLCSQRSGEMAESAMENEKDRSSITPQKNSGDGDLTCKVCFIETPTRNALYEHTKVAHFKLKEDLKCSTCGKHFSKRDLFRKHVKAHRKQGWGKTHKCDICEKVFNNLSSLINHSAIHEKGQSFKSGPFLCDLCGSVFKTTSSFNTHRREKHETAKNNYQCVHCGKRFYYISRLKRHAVVHTKDGLRKCDLCDMKFRYHYEYIMHVNEHRGIQQHSCRVCHRFFKKKSTLLRHMHKLHDIKNAFRCDECDFGSPDFNAIEKHKLERHGASAKIVANAEQLGAKPFVYENRYRCKECGQAFHLKYDLHIHENRHLGVEPFTCLVCGKEFLVEKTYKNHMSMHGAMAVKYKCEECGDGYKSYKQFKKHVEETHNKKLVRIKPYEKDLRFKCEECDEKFHRKYELKLHMARHTGLETFACALCQKEFLKYKSYLNHMTSHKEPGMKYRCKRCDIVFKSYRQLRIHMSDVHNKKLKKNRNESLRDQTSPSHEEPAPAEAEEATVAMVPTQSVQDAPDASVPAQPELVEVETVTMAGEDPQVDPTLAIIQMLCQEQQETIVVVQQGE